MYALNYSDGGKKTEQLRMTFDDRGVTERVDVPRQAAEPPHHPGDPGAARRRARSDERGVLERAFARTRTAISMVCNQTLPVFDGMQRFDLVITPKRAVNVQRATPGGYAGPAVICAVKFIPIAGYQPDNPGIRLMSQTNEIEVWLIPVRDTKMYVPYRIVLPTPIGYGSALVTSIQVAGARRASAEP